MSYSNLLITELPPSPLLDFNFEQALDSRQFPTILEIKNTLLTTSGRASIAMALEHANIGAGDEVLIPAYHCEAMVAPAKWCGARVVFYRVNRDTSIQLEDIEAKITPSTKAIIVTHYFGFEQELLAVRNICNQRDIVLIEDCAHAMFGLASGEVVGFTGDYAIASCMKFLPIYEGGLLCSSRRDISNIKLGSPSLLFQLKSAINCLEKSVHYHRLGFWGGIINSILQIKDQVWIRLKKLKFGEDAVKLGPSSSDGGSDINEAWIHVAISHFSRWVMQKVNLDDIALRRRQNYKTINAVLSELPGCHPLFTSLSDHTVPWVYPLYIDQPEKYFLSLKTQGVPIWRFGEFLDSAVTAELCPVSMEYSKHIFQFPCHQSLTAVEIDWMLNKIKQTFAE